MYLTVLSHFNIKQVNTLGDICNENILVMSKGNVGKKTALIVIQIFWDHHHIYIYIYIHTYISLIYRGRLF